MDYIAHTTEDGRKQPLIEHLRGTAELCRSFAVEGLKDIAYYCGLMHDIGKYSMAFQRRIRGENVRVSHALSGAQAIAEKVQTNSRAAAWAYMLEYCIAGHHSGLPDGGSASDNEDTATLHAVLKRKGEDYSAYEQEVKADLPDGAIYEIMMECKSEEELFERYAFFTRYMYSCLTDADFLDTENFFTPDSDRIVNGDFRQAYRRVCDRLKGFKAVTELQKARGVIQEQVYESVKGEADIYTVDMPTGSGKTLCSIKAALEIAIAQNKKRVIYVIPYVSIIEQTAGIFEDIFGTALPVVQHQSNYDADENGDENVLTSEKIKRACENWDAPLIVTTNVQFFTSLYAHKSSRMRKLHNLADSVIIFDEVHMLPVEYIKPCIRAIGYVTRFLNAKAILMSATMPDYTAFIKEYAPDAKVADAVCDKSLFKSFAKCRYNYIGEISYEKLCEKAGGYESVLIVVNRRRTARELYRIIGGNKYHLSTYMTPFSRSSVIARIREDIKSGRQVMVISTSLIEAGVDLDFEAVFRENAGIDNIIQAGGRCNREGKRKTADVFVFDTEDGAGDIRANITRKLFEETGDITEGSCIKEYYRRLFSCSGDKISNNTIISLMGRAGGLDCIPFREYSQNFRFIDSDTFAVVIPDENNEELIRELKSGKLSVKRKLQKYSASVKFYELKNMMSLGIVDVLDCGVCVLNNTDYYDDNTGLVFEQDKDYFI